jgi:hypothetical protein
VRCRYAAWRANRCVRNGCDVGGVLAEIGKNLADRWLSLLVLPGALFLAVLAAARTLGQSHAFDVQRLVHQVSAWADSSALHSTPALVVILLAVLLGSAAAGLVAQGAGSLIEYLALAAGWQSWPAPLRTIASRRLSQRRRHWNDARDSYLRERDDAARARALSRIGNQRSASTADLAAAHERMTRISPEYPGRPTWMGDRIQAVTIRLDRDYDLDLATVWPYLWLTMPEQARTEVTTSRQSLTSATTLAGWGVMYLVTAAWWWPGVLVAAVTIATARHRARTAADTYARMLDAATRLYSSDLARQLGIEHTGLLDPGTGWTLTCLLQGRADLIPGSAPIS